MGWLGAHCGYVTLGVTYSAPLGKQSAAQTNRTSTVLLTARTHIHGIIWSGLSCFVSNVMSHFLHPIMSDFCKQIFLPCPLHTFQAILQFCIPLLNLCLLGPKGNLYFIHFGHFTTTI